MIKYLRRITSFCHEITIKVYSNIHVLREGVVFKNGASKNNKHPESFAVLGGGKGRSGAKKNGEKKQFREQDYRRRYTDTKISAEKQNGKVKSKKLKTKMKK